MPGLLQFEILEGQFIKESGKRLRDVRTFAVRHSQERNFTHVLS